MNRWAKNLLHTIVSSMAVPKRDKLKCSIETKQYLVTGFCSLRMSWQAKEKANEKNKTKKGRLTENVVGLGPFLFILFSG